MVGTVVGDGDFASASEMVDAYVRSCVLTEEIEARRLELARLEAVFGPRRQDPTFMALLHMLAGRPPGAASPGPASLLAPSQPGGSADAVAEEARGQRRSRWDQFGNGYSLGQIAAREGKPRDLNGLRKGWRLRGFVAAYDRIVAGTLPDLVSDYRTMLISMDEAPDADEVAAMNAHAAAPAAVAVAHEMPTEAEVADGEAAPTVEDDGFVPEADGPGEADDEAGGHVGYGMAGETGSDAHGSDVVSATGAGGDLFTGAARS